MAGVLRLTVPARCVRGQNSRRGVQPASCAPNVLPRFDRRGTLQKQRDRPPTPRRSDRAKKFCRRVPWRGTRRAQRRRSSKETSPRRRRRGGGAPRAPARRRRHNTKEGNGNLKRETRTSRPRPARASATPSPPGPPGRRPSRSRRSSAARRRPRRARLASGPRPRASFLPASAGGGA